MTQSLPGLFLAMPGAKTPQIVPAMPKGSCASGGYLREDIVPSCMTYCKTQENYQKMLVKNLCIIY